MPKIVDHDRRRGELLDASLALFSVHGYAGLGMRTLAAELSVSTGTLYHYFPNKSALFEAMLSRLANADVVGVIERIETGMSRAKKLELVVDFVVFSAAAIREIIDVLIDYRRTVGSEGDALVSSVLEVYRRSLAVHLLDGDEERADEVLSVVIGVLMHAGLQGDSDVCERQIRSLLPLVVLRD